MKSLVIPRRRQAEIVERVLFGARVPRPHPLEVEQLKITHLSILAATTDIAATLTRMANDREVRRGKPPIGMAGVTALTLAVVGVLLVVFTFPLLKIVGMLLAVAALIVGVVGAINARRQGLAGSWLGWAGASLAALTIVSFLIWWPSSGL